MCFFFIAHLTKKHTFFKIYMSYIPTFFFRKISCSPKGLVKVSTDPYGCFRKWWYHGVPPNHPFNRVFHYKPSILGYPYFWKHPYRNVDVGNWLFRRLRWVTSSDPNATVTFSLPHTFLGRNDDLSSRTFGPRLGGWGGWALFYSGKN